ncbi:acyltransferase family protein [Nocardia sp. KC 131]|uniref:acyltransferase family protein n=1 Tax=Nocardia arseniciresistens TaxID=3392119 RepID=UPI00398E33A0
MPKPQDVVPRNATGTSTFALRSADPIGRTQPAKPSTAAREYRHDLDGLRGIAIALVVVFHVWMGRVSGGVDVFLVLSGFFFTSMLLRRAGGSGSIGVGQVLWRTARRLLPALTVVLATVVVATVVMRPYTQWGDITAQTLASAFYYQNWHLAYAQLDYAAPDPSVSPLQHLWSMSVQGQFYLAMLAVVALWVSVRRRLPAKPLHRCGFLALLTVVGAVSFWYAAEGSAQHQAWIYYDSGARAWELLVGALLATAAPWITVPPLLRTVLALLGVAGVLSCGLLIDGATRFPGPAALFPVAAAAALILSGMNAAATPQPLPNRILGMRAFTELGALGYALYLWHWPVLIFYLAEYGNLTPGIGGGLLVIATSLVLALATQRLIETPLRQPAVANGATRSTATPPRYNRGVGMLVSILGIGVLAAVFGWQAVLKANPSEPPALLDPVDYPGAATLLAGTVGPSERMRPSVFEGSKDAPKPTFDGCITPNRDVRSCTYGDETASHAIAVVGGSHSEHWLPALELLALEHHFRIVTFLKEGCPLTLSDEPSYALAPFPECHEWSTEILDLLAEQRPDWVFITATRPGSDDGDEVPPEFLDIWSALSDRGLNALAIRDTPWLRRDGVHYRATDCLANHGTPDSCGMDRALVLEPNNPAEQPASAYPNIFPLDLTDAVCRADRCRVVEGNVLIYRDEHHLTASYVRSLAPELGRQIGSITRWW